MLGWLNYGWIMVDTCLNKVGDAPHLGLTHEDLEIESASDNLSVLHFFMVGSMLIFPGLVTSWCLYVRACILCASLCWLVLLAFTIQIHFEPAAFAEATLPCPCHSLTFGPPQGEKKTVNHWESEATASVRDCCALRQVAKRTWLCLNMRHQPRLPF